MSGGTCAGGTDTKCRVKPPCASPFPAHLNVRLLTSSVQPLVNKHSLGRLTCSRTLRLHAVLLPVHRAQRDD
eukprot:UN4129